MNNFIKRFIASLLVILSIISLMPFEFLNTYATGGDYVGDGGGNVLVTGRGDFDAESCGYRFWLMSKEGTRVPGTKIVDILYRDVTQSKQVNWTFNTKVEPWTGSMINKDDVKFAKFSDVKAIEGSQMPRPIIYTSNFIGRGKEFREWLTNGLESLEPSGGSGNSSGGWSHYVSGGGITKPSNGGNTGGNTGSSGNNNKPTQAQMKTIDYYLTLMQRGTESKAKSLNASKSRYTRANALLALKTRIKEYYESYLKTFNAQKLPTGMLKAKYDILNSQASSMLDRTGWKPAKQQQIEDMIKDKVNGNTTPRTDASKIISNLFDTAYATNDTLGDLIKKEPDGTFIIDFAYAAETDDTVKGQEVTAKGHLGHWLDNGLGNWLNAYNNPNIEKRDRLDKSFGASGIKIIIEPIVWFQPATLTRVNGSYKPGKSPNWRFYGTPTTYASMMEYNRTHGGFYDGGNGGWNSYPMNAVTSVCLFINGDLNIPSKSPYISGVENTHNRVVKNNELCITNKGYAMHYVRFGKDAGDDPGLPMTHTYDTDEIDPNPNPHPAPDPSPEKLKLVPGELEQPGDPITPDNPTPENPGYKNTTRTIHIVKVYDIKKEDGSIKHVKTLERDFNPGTIQVQHEEDYKCIGYFSSINYFGWYSDTGKVNEDLPWETFRGNPIIPANNDILWETTYESVKDKKGKEVQATVKIGLAADPQYKEEEGREPNSGYNDTTLYVHLQKVEKVPETSTYDEPDNPPIDNPPYVPPHPAEDPKSPNVNDPETDPVEDDNEYCHYRIVKVYDTIYINGKTGAVTEIVTDQVFETYETNPIVYIQDEGQNNPKKNDPSWHLIGWLYGDEFNQDLLYTGGDEPRWDYIVQPVIPIEQGTSPSKVDLRDPSEPEKTVTLYVHLRKTQYIDEIYEPGKINIEQSQISKTIHSNDKNIGDMFGKYKFDISIGNFQTQHTYTYTIPVPYGYTDYYGNYISGVNHVPQSGVCQLQMPGTSGDNQARFVFDQIGSQHKLEVKLGTHSKTDARVYGNGGASGVSRQDAMQYPETVPGMTLAENHFKYTSDGKDSKGAEYVTVLWRGGAPKADIPTLAKFKEKDIKNHYGVDNWEIPNAMLKNADRKSRKQRATAAQKDTLSFQFGFSRTHSAWDEEVYASCLNMGAGRDNMVGCIYQDKSKRFQTMEGTSWQYPFKAAVAIQFYAGKSKSLAAEAPSKANIQKKGGAHYVAHVTQGKHQIKFYPYIRMTYMLPNLDDAIAEEDNTYENGHPNPGVRYDTYVLAERESSILPSDAIQLGWKHKDDNNTLTLTSQQWSLHKRAISGSDGWQGRNQVLPGGAIYQLATKKDDPAIVQLITYNTVVDDKARQEYLTATNTIPSDVYVVGDAVDALKDFVNDAKEVLDNLNIVQWVNKNANASTAWNANFQSGGNAVKLAGKGEDLSPLNESGRKVMTANLDDKYYMRGNTFTTSSGEVKGSLTDFQSAKISDRTYEIRNNTGKMKDEQSNSGDLDVSKVWMVATVYKTFTDTQGNVYYAKREKTLNGEAMENAKVEIENMVKEMKDINGDNLGNSTLICGKTTPYSKVNELLNSIDKGLKVADDLTKYVTNTVKSVERNTGDDSTASWVGGTSEKRWYNEAFDGFYLVKQEVNIETTFQYSPMRVATLDPALCPVNRGQSDLYTKAFLSQFCVDSRSDAAVADGKADHYIGTYDGVDMFLPDMELMYQSKKFYIPNANVQDLN